jgi:uncharacterized repeat protein (TIGR03843 family)
VPFDVEAHYFTLLEQPARHRALRTIGCFDLLANSADRKGGHCLAGHDGRVWAVDNGLTFHAEPKLRTVIWDFSSEVIDDDLLAGVRRVAETGGPESLAGLIDDEERDALVERAVEVVDTRTFPIDTSGRCYPWPLV